MDAIFDSWLETQHSEGMALAAASDRLALQPGAEAPPREYLAHFDCRTVVKSGAVVKVWDGGCTALVRFPADYLRVVNPAWVVALLRPARIHHPNVAPPAICLGHISPGTPLVELLHQIHDILTFHKVTPREDDALDREACAWARANLQRFPVDDRPLRRRALELDLSPITPEAGA